MRVFMTGATGFIGTELVRELLGAGHQVLGLARGEAGAERLTRLGAEVHRGDTQDLASLRRGAEDAEAVVHLAFDHDFARFAQNCENDRRAIEALGDALTGTTKLLLVTSGTGMGRATPGAVATEEAPALSSQEIPRAASEEAANAVAQRGVRVGIVRLPQVHDTRKAGLVSFLTTIAREQGFVAYVGDGANRWPAVHVTDAARLYRLAVEKTTGSARYNAVAEEGVSLREIADVLGAGLKLPVRSIAASEAAGYFGWMAHFAGADNRASSARTREALGWAPTGPGLLEDLRQLAWV